MQQSQTPESKNKTKAIDSAKSTKAKSNAESAESTNPKTRIKKVESTSRASQARAKSTTRAPKADSSAKEPKRITTSAKVFFGVAFAIALFLIIDLYYAFLNDMLIAALLCIATYWIKDALQKRTRSNLIASILSVIILLAIFIIPLYFVIHRGTLSLLSIDWKQAEAWFLQIKQLILGIASHVPFLQMEDIFQNISISSLATHATRISTNIGKGSVSFVIDICFIVLFLSVWFYYGGSWYAHIKSLLPARSEQVDLIALDVSGVLRIVFLSTILNVCLQGFAFGVAASFFGLDGVLLGVLYGLCSLIPIVGGALIWIPVGLLLYVQGDIFGAVFLVVYSVVFIGFVIDNVVKPFLIRIVNRKLLDKPLNINEFVIFFAIFAGLGAFGFWGIIIGPAITAFFIVMMRIYERDFAPLAQENDADINQAKANKAD
ncbi:MULTISPECIES: AI-2E family transporter [unclassified Helicobacter]|uniref:AI-2E family transporter n=1 Tax=unclassified Helicobacter TaxID=2593540 RepID=UPI0009EDD29B|nr:MULTISPECIES: AI-2E family transporter [unclassified Helicobacter]